MSNRKEFLIDDLKYLKETISDSLNRSKHLRDDEIKDKISLLKSIIQNSIDFINEEYKDVV